MNKTLKMFWKRKLAVRAEELAALLFEEFVQTATLGAAEEFQLDTTTTSASGKKLQLYQYANVLLAVLNAERLDAAFTPVRECLERHFLPPTFVQGAKFLKNLRCATRDLAVLIQPDGKPSPLS